MNATSSEWQNLPLHQVCEVILGQSPPGSDYNTEGVGLPFFQGKAEFGDTFPRVMKWTTTGAKRALPGDVLLSVRAPVGPTNLAEQECVIGRGLAALRAREVILPRYLLWAMRLTAEALSDKSSGSTFAAVSGSQVREHRIQVAPLEEQRQIVEVIEEQFSRLDAAEASLAAAQTLSRKLRRGVLKSAFSGKLVTSSEKDTALPQRTCFALSTNEEKHAPS